MKQKKNPLWKLIGSLLATAVLATLQGCGPAPIAETKTVPLSAVRTVITAATPFTQYLQLTGTVEADTVASLSSPAEGPVLQLTVREGDAVESGQILLRIGRTSGAEAELVAAEEAWQTQQKEFDRVSRLVDERALAGEQLDQARAALERSRSQLSRARQASQDFTITAPWNGLVSKLHVSEGRYVAPRMPLVDVFDPSSLLLRFQVPERHAFLITVGQELRASFDAFPEETLNLKILRAWPELDRRLRSRTFQASLPLDRFPFAPGQFSRISLKIKEVQDAITLPATALVVLPDATEGVFVVDDSGIAQARDVRVGGESDGLLWIAEGLKTGEQVVIEGQQNLKPGQQVRLVPPARS